MACTRRPALLMIAALLSVPTGATGQERPGGVSTAATLTVLSVPVERVGVGSDRPAAVASGSDLAVGDRVVTGTDGRALITFLDGTTVTVEPASEVTVRQAQMEGRQASRIGVLVTVGTVWARVAGWLGGRATVTIESNAYSATAHDGLIGAQQQPGGGPSAGRGREPSRSPGRRVRRRASVRARRPRSSPAVRSSPRASR
jgi:hypothetical protein